MVLLPEPETPITTSIAGAGPLTGRRPDAGGMCVRSRRGTQVRGRAADLFTEGVKKPLILPGPGRPRIEPLPSRPQPIGHPPMSALLLCALCVALLLAVVRRVPAGHVQGLHRRGRPLRMLEP